MAYYPPPAPSFFSYWFYKNIRYSKNCKEKRVSSTLIFIDHCHGLSERNSCCYGKTGTRKCLFIASL